MSATKAEGDWRWIRAYCVIDAYVKDCRAGRIAHLPLAYYGRIFDLDEDEVEELFDDVAKSMQVSIACRQDHTYH
jgi:hypothetical protein